MHDTVIAVVATLLTIFITLPVQHFFWIRRRAEELRFEVVEEINRLASEYATKSIDAHNIGTSFDPSEAFFESLRAWDMKLRVLFSEKTHKVYKEMEIMIAHGGLKPATVDGFIKAHEATLRCLYDEAGVFEGLLGHLRTWASRFRVRQRRE